MKNIIWTITIVISAYSSFGQSMFFETLNSTTWASESDISELTLKSFKEIPLEKLIYSKDSIYKDLTIWTFRENVLTIVKYSFNQKLDSIVGKYNYSVHDNCILKIILQDGSLLKFKVGIVSSGYNAVLYSLKKKSIE